MTDKVASKDASEVQVCIIAIHKYIVGVYTWSEWMCTVCVCVHMRTYTVYVGAGLRSMVCVCVCVWGFTSV